MKPGYCGFTFLAEEGFYASFSGLHACMPAAAYIYNEYTETPLKKA